MSKSFLQIFLFDSLFFIFKLFKLYKSYFFLGYTDINYHNKLINNVKSFKLFNNLVFVKKSYPFMLNLIYNDKKTSLTNTINQIKYASNNEKNVYLLVLDYKLEDYFIKKTAKIKNCNLLFIERLNINILKNIDFSKEAKVYIYINDESLIDFSIFQFRSEIQKYNLKPIIFIYYNLDNKQSGLLANSYPFFNLKTIF